MLKKQFPIHSYLAFICLLFIFSCKKDINSSFKISQNSVSLSADSNFVSLSFASAAAKQVNTSRLVSDIVKKRSVNGFNLPVTKEVQDSIAVPNAVNPSYYIFNYKGGGYVIIPADKRVEPILSYSDGGYFPKSGKLPAGLVNWLSVNHKNMQLLRKNTTLKIPAVVAKLWAELGVSPKNNTKTINKLEPTPPPCEDTWSIVTVGPLLKTTWAQGYPYNQLCPAGNYSFSHMPSGCVATAMAQLMYYWKMPTSYNWSVMPLSSIYPGSSAGNNEVARLMLNIGTSVNMVYKDDGSYPKVGYSFPASIGSISCSTALKNNFGYGSATDANFDYSKVQSNLNARQPVLLGGTTDNTTILFWSFGTDGHEWVCDGYQEITFTGCPGEPVLGETTLLFDMNWGWNEVGSTTNVNGWYGFNNWSVYNGSTQENFKYNQVMSYNIHP